MSSVRKRRTRRQAAAKHKKRRPRSAEQYSKLSAADQRRYDSALHVLSTMRQRGISLSAAARENGVSLNAVKQFAGSGLRKNGKGRYVARASDSLLRVLVMPTRSGLAEIAISGSRDATLLGDYWNAVHLFLETGDDSKLRTFRGKSVAAVDGSRVTLMTDLDELERLGSAGVLSFESIYGRAA